MESKQTKSLRDRGFDFINSIYAGAALMVICGVSAILYTHYGQTWERPIINGLITAVVVLSLFLSVRAVLSLPAATNKITPENVGTKILTWLHKFGLTVQTLNRDSERDFVFKVITDGGKTIFVERHLSSFPDYISVHCGIALTEEEKQILDTMSDLEKYEALFQIQRELWRGGFGYDSRNVATTGLIILLRIPITATISETSVIDAIWRMEAIVSHIIAMNSMAVVRYKANKEVSGEGRIQ
jgi:hypothetical protein